MPESELKKWLSRIEELEEIITEIIRELASDKMLSGKLNVWLKERGKNGSASHSNQ